MPFTNLRTYLKQPTWNGIINTPSTAFQSICTPSETSSVLKSFGGSNVFGTGVAGSMNLKIQWLPGFNLLGGIGAPKSRSQILSPSSHDPIPEDCPSSDSGSLSSSTTVSDAATASSKDTILQPPLINVPLDTV